MPVNKPYNYLPVLLIFLSFFSSQAFATGSLKISEEGDLNVNADVVWEVIGDFGGLAKWLNPNMSVELQGTSTDAGSTRTLTMGNGFSITEALVDYSKENRSYSYIVIGGGGSVKNYLSTLKVVPTGANTSKVVWSATFDPGEGADDAAAREGMSNIYKGAIEGIKQHFKTQ
jgi:carbon monoxide dehydrogenase subunit G